MQEETLRATELAEGLARLETLQKQRSPQDVGHLQEVIRDLQTEVASLRARQSEAEEDMTRKKSRMAAPSTPLAILNGGTPQSGGCEASHPGPASQSKFHCACLLQRFVRSRSRFSIWK